VRGDAHGSEAREERGHAEPRDGHEAHLLHIKYRVGRVIQHGQAAAKHDLGEGLLCAAEEQAVAAETDGDAEKH
jgi:hypothetical protein